jgi:hypothetical protein
MTGPLDDRIPDRIAIKLRGMPAERATQAAQVLLRLHYRELARRGRADLPGAPRRPQRHGRSA